MDLGHHGLESQADLQYDLRKDPNHGSGMPQNITYAPQTRDFGPRAVQKLQKPLAPQYFAFIFAASVRFLLFRNFYRRVNSDRLLAFEKARSPKSAWSYEYQGTAPHRS